MAAEISIIIPTFNSERTIGSCLTSVRKQTVDCDELFVVDRHSVDTTPNIARQFGASLLQSTGNRSVARNTGLRRSSCSSVVFIDSDMILPSTLVEECLEKLKSSDALVIPEVSEGSGFWAQCKKLERQTYRGSDLNEAARAFRRSALLSIGAYDQNLEAGEDWELQARATRNGLVTKRVSSTIIHDEGKLKLITCMRRKYSYGKTIGRYIKLNPSAGLRQLNPFSRVLGSTVPAMSKDPVHGGGVFVMKSLEFVAGAVGHLSEQSQLIAD